MGLIDSSKFDSLSAQGLSAEDLLNFQQDGIDYLYDLEPAENNLFWAGNFHCYDTKNNAVGEKPLNRFANAQFRIKSLNFALPKLEFETIKQTHTRVLKSIAYPETMSITWVEDAYRSVKKYHLDWLNHWYNREFDCLRCGPRQKLRGLNIVLFHYVEGVEKFDNPLASAPVAQPILVINIRGMAPMDLGGIKLDTSDASPEYPNITYSIQRASLFYWSDLMSNDWLSEGEDDSKASATDIKPGIWNPEALATRTDTTEGGRIARAVTQTLISEGRIG